MQTLWKSIETDREALAKQRDQEAKYKIPFTRYHTGDGYMIRPCLSPDVDVQADESAAKTIEAWFATTNTRETQIGVAFTYIAQSIGLDIVSVLRGCSHLLATKKIIGDIGRSGKVVGCHPVRS